MRGGCSVVVVVLFVACAGPDTPVNEPYSSTATQVSKVPSDSRNCSNESLWTPQESSKSEVIPPGFWCAESRRTASDNPLHVCFSSEKKCNLLRQTSIQSGNQVSACRERDTAVCFTMTDKVEQRVHWRCYEGLEDCLPLREKWLGDQPDFRFGECVLTKPHVYTTPRTATPTAKPLRLPEESLARRSPNARTALSGPDWLQNNAWPRALAGYSGVGSP